jgi:hypothetical protein
VRSPVGCWLLALVTLGIYALFWYHHTNKELRDYDPRTSSGAIGVLLTFVLGLWLPYYISQANTVWESAGATR